MAGLRECRIVWLDLRNATVAQALDWLTGLTKLDWRASEARILVGSQRLLPGEPAWVYEVSRLIHPAEAFAASENVSVGLSEAAAGQLDLEALIELQSAWSDPQAETLVNGAGALLSLRSAFAIGEAARSLPRDEEIQRLARNTQTSVQKRATAALSDFASRPEDAEVCLPALYAALLGNHPEVKERMRSALRPPTDDGGLSIPTVAAALLADRPDATWMVKALYQEPRVNGEDWVVLAALAARRSGREAWDLWRNHAPKVLCRQMLPGSVVVLVNQLGRSALLVAR